MQFYGRLDQISLRRCEAVWYRRVPNNRDHATRGGYASYLFENNGVLRPSLAVFPQGGRRCDRPPWGIHFQGHGRQDMLRGLLSS